MIFYWGKFCGRSLAVLIFDDRRDFKQIAAGVSYRWHAAKYFTKPKQKDLHPTLSSSCHSTFSRSLFKKK
jgi:hypothetical protein